MGKIRGAQGGLAAGTGERAMARESLSRREFLGRALAGAVAIAGVGGAGRALAFSDYRWSAPREPVKRFAFAQLRHAGASWDPWPTGPAQLVRELEQMTSVEARPGRVELTLDSPDLFSYPFLYVAGAGDFEPFSEAQVERLRAWLSAGGLLVADDAGGTPGYGFDAAVRRELARVLPGESLRRLPQDHTVFKSFFLIRGAGGRRVVSPFLEGVSVQERTVAVLCPNDLGGAWARDSLGRWQNPCVPGGERQRRLAFQLGVNLVMYALCADYKQDQIHLPFLRQRI